LNVLNLESPRRCAVRLPSRSVHHSPSPAWDRIRQACGQAGPRRGYPAAQRRSGMDRRCGSFRQLPATCRHTTPQQGLEIVPRNASFLGAELGADSVCVLGRPGPFGTPTDLTFKLGGFHAHLIAERWLTGHPAAESSVTLSQPRMSPWAQGRQSRRPATGGCGFSPAG